MESNNTLIYPSTYVEQVILPNKDDNKPVHDFTPSIDSNYQERLSDTNNSSQSESKRVMSIPHALSMPVVDHPIANYYTKINWDNGYERWNLCRFATPMDGHCLFHAIANSFFSPYHNQTLNGKHISRTAVVTQLRKELASRLAEIDTFDPLKRTYYQCLAGGNTAIFAEAVPEFTLSFMQAQLDSSAPIGYGYIEYICNALNKDIYILSAAHRDMYVFDELQFCIKGNRKSIVVYYMNGHYELVGIQHPDGSFDTHFKPDHSFICFLNDIVKEVTTNTK